MVCAMVIQSRRSGAPPAHPESAAERAERIRREAEVIALARTELDAGLGIEEEEAEAWLDALEADEDLPLPEPPAGSIPRL